MRLILVGCEYVGKTTLADALQAWGLERGRNFHMDDHFTIPDAQHVNEEEQEAMLALPGCGQGTLPALSGPLPRAPVASLRRHYPGRFSHRGGHLRPTLLLPGPGDDLRTPGRAGVPARCHPGAAHGASRGDPRPHGQAAPHRHSVVPPADVEAVQQQFETAYGASWVPRKVRLDTSELRPEQILDRFLEVVRPRLNGRDLLLLDNR